MILAANPTSDEMVAAAFPLVAIEAKRFRHFPPGVTADDLESLGGELLLQAAAEFTGRSDEWGRYAKFYLRNGYKSFVARARAASNRHVPITIRLEGRDGNTDEAPRPDPKAGDPAAIAAVREALTQTTCRRSRRHVSVRQLESSLPPPALVADQVTKLREAMFNSISVEDVRDVMQAMVREAKAGDPKAMKLLIDLLAPAKSGVVLQQQAVVIHPGDVE